MQWRLPFGANVEPDGIRFRLWAPDAKQVDVVVGGQGRAEARLVMHRGTEGYHHGFLPDGCAGVRYAYALDGDVVPDPASRSQPDGVHGCSEVVDPAAFAWSDGDWRGLDRERLVIYELHIGTFTSAGTFDAAIGRLDDLAALGVTAVEVMPVASFAGSRNWGYDGVALFAPSVHYGGPCGFKRFVDAAHRRGLGVILDVVYNHLGPEGNYLPRTTGGRICNPRHRTVWGDALNYDGADSAPVRDFVLQNALYWAHEYHVDGLRLDAAHAMVDDSAVHILREISAALHALPVPRLVIAEDDRNERRLLLPPDQGGLGLDAVWADDLHHQLRRLSSGDADGYFRSYAGRVADVAQTLRRGWYYEGQWSAHHEAPRGTSTDGLPPSAFVHCLQNHDQVGNRAAGDRLHHAIPPELYRALSVLLLLSPYTPLIWMGQEWAASTPFRFFTNFGGELGDLVREGRKREFAAFSSFGDALRVPDPEAESTFEDSKLRWRERDEGDHKAVVALYTELLTRRAAERALLRRDRESVTVEVPHEDVLVMRRSGHEPGADIVVVVNLGARCHSLPIAACALALPNGHDWHLVLSTEEARFGGSGHDDYGITATGEIRLPGASAVVLRAARRA